MKTCINCNAINKEAAAVCSSCMRDLPAGDAMVIAAEGGKVPVADAPSDPGKWVMIGGVLLGAYAFFIYDVSNGGFVNLGLMDNRRNMLMVAGVMVVVGAILKRKKAV